MPVTRSWDLAVVGNAWEMLKAQPGLWVLGTLMYVLSLIVPMIGIFAVEFSMLGQLRSRADKGCSQPTLDSPYGGQMMPDSGSQLAEKVPLEHSGLRQMTSPARNRPAMVSPAERWRKRRDLSGAL